MATHKLSAKVADWRGASTLARLIESAIEPAPAAVSLFEEHTRASGWSIDVYFAEPPDVAAFHRQLESLLDGPPPAFAGTSLADQNWVAISQSSLSPVAAGRFTVHGSHDRGRVPGGPLSIEIDAGEAFGTAHHATTAACLLALDQLVRRRGFARVLDLGCGTGILAIAAARVLPRAKIVASDIDPLAIAVATANTRLNGVGRRIALISGDVTAMPPSRRPRRFDLILANILAPSLVALAPRLRRLATAQGKLVLSGLLTAEVRQVIAVYRAHGFALEGHRRLEEWSALTFVRGGGDCRRRPSRVKNGRCFRASSPRRLQPPPSG